MKKLTLLLTLALSSSLFAQREAYIVNGLAETLSLIDLETGVVTNHITLLGETPNQVVYYDNYLYVVNSVSAEVMKIDISSQQVVFDFLLPIGSSPYNMACYGGRAYVTGWISGRVYRLNLAQNMIDGEVEIGGYPEGVICYDGYLYVAQTYFNPDNYTYGQGKIAKIDLSDFSFVGDYNVGKNPQWISATPDGRLHIVCTGNYADIEGSVYIFDAGAGIVTDSIQIGGQPANLAISPLGIGYLAAGGWTTTGHVYSYDIFSGDIIRGPANPIAVGLGASSIASDSSGFIYCCSFGDDTVSKIGFGGNVIGSYNLGDGPLSITIIDDTPIGVDEEEMTNIPESPYMIKAYPNPFNSGIKITLEGPDYPSNEIQLDIFDISGRLTKTFIVETSGGRGEVYWDGADNSNNGCASGIYFGKVRKTAKGEDGQIRRKTLKMTVIR